jgi:predicted nucleic acid-binding protein
VRTVFVDTFYWIARIDPHDQWHQKAKELSDSLHDTRLLTTRAVLVELLNYFSGYGPEMRQAVAQIVRRIDGDSQVEVTPGLFDEGLHLFGARLDKGYSMTDCMSMSTMNFLGLTEVLTHDRHFAQEGFVVLL